MTADDAPKPPPRESNGAVFALVAALIVAFALAPRLFPRSEGALAGKDAPDFALSFVLNAPSDASPAATLSALRGRAVLLDFWATWCGPCQAETPVIDGIARRYKDKGLTVVGVNTSDEPGNAAPWASAHHVSYAIAYDANQKAASAFGVDSLPTLVVISREGKVVAMRSGVTSDAELDALVKKAL
jgi:thiol-disulfide isomerase/thioredoxin